MKLMKAVQLSGFTGSDTKEIVSEPGHVREQTIENFLAAG